jgi:hypothetical protein
MTRDGGGPARVAGAIGVVWVVAYVIIVTGPSTELGANGAFYACFVGVMSTLCVVSALSTVDPRLAQVIRYAAAPGLVLAGALGIASIGLPLVLAGLLALASAGPRQVSIRAGAAAGAVSTLVFLTGISITWPSATS